MKDKRYTVTQEWTGQPTPQWVVRFERKWISSHATKEESNTARSKYIEDSYHLQESE